jgi:uncharacterized protein YfdQ (DUF2303 family)
MTEDTATAEVVRDLAIQATKPHCLDPGDYYALTTSTGAVVKIDLTGDEYREFPKRKGGIVTVRNVASFARYYAKHADEGSEVFADLDKGTVTAVLDAHRGNDADGDGLAAGEGARWQQHRLILGLVPTLPWQEWTAKDRDYMGQQAFAEFIEEHARDVDPAGKIQSADLLETAQNFKATLKVAITAGARVSSGQTQFSYIEEITATGQNAKRGTIEMPNEFDLLIAPYEDIEPAVMAVRLRYRIGQDKSLALGYFMNEPARVAREAVAKVVAKLAEECSVTVMHGQPA